MSGRTLHDLEQLATNAGPTFEEDFKAVHHFSRNPPFSSPTSSFSTFARYCKSLSRGIRPGEENDQTIQRAYKYLSHITQGVAPTRALELAWREFPLVTRQ